MNLFMSRYILFFSKRDDIFKKRRAHNPRSHHRNGTPAHVQYNGAARSAPLSYPWRTSHMTADCGLRQDSHGEKRELVSFTDDWMVR